MGHTKPFNICMTTCQEQKRNSKKCRPSDVLRQAIPSEDSISKVPPWWKQVRGHVAKWLLTRSLPTIFHSRAEFPHVVLNKVVR